MDMDDEIYVLDNASFEVKLCFSIGNFHHLILFIFQFLGDHSNGDTNSLLFKVLQKWVGVDTNDYFFEVKMIKKTFHASGKFLDEQELEKEELPAIDATVPPSNRPPAYCIISSPIYTPTSPIYFPTSSSP